MLKWHFLFPTNTADKNFRTFKEHFQVPFWIFQENEAMAFSKPRIIRLKICPSGHVFKRKKMQKYRLILRHYSRKLWLKMILKDFIRNIKELKDCSRSVGTRSQSKQEHGLSYYLCLFFYSSRVLYAFFLTGYFKKNSLIFKFKVNFLFLTT